MRPMRAVVDAMNEGACTYADISHRTGLSSSTVEAVIMQLERMNYIQRVVDLSSCSGGCSSCVSAQSCGSALPEALATSAVGGCCGGDAFEGRKQRAEVKGKVGRVKRSLPLRTGLVSFRIVRPLPTLAE